MKRNKIFIFLMVSLTLLFIGKSSYGQWYEINSGVYDNLLDGCFVNDSVGFIIGYDGKVLKTNDAGNSWAVNVTLNGNFSSISHIGTDTIFIGGTSFYMSTNGGDTWNLVSNPNFWILDIVFFNSHVGFALSPEYDECTWIYGTNYTANYKIYKTIDQGLTWQLHSANIETRGRFEKINDNSALIIGGYHSIVAHCGGPWYNASRKTMDGGENWYGITQPQYGNSLISFINDDIGFYIQPSEVFFKTTDGGNSMTQLNTSSLPYMVDHFKFVDEQNGYFIAKNKILKTDTSVLDWNLDYISFDTLNYFFDNGNQYLFCIGKNGKILRKNITPNTPIDSISRIALNPNDLNFSYVETDSSRIKRIYLINNGTLPLDLNLSSSTAFSISVDSINYQSNLSFTLYANEDTAVYVKFKPFLETVYSDIITVDYGAGNLLTLALNGIGYYGFKGEIISDTLICVDTLRISGDLIIKPNVKLSICPGTFVQFLGDSKLLVEGQLIAIGDTLNPIEFWALNNNNIKCLGLIISNTSRYQIAAQLDFCNFRTPFYQCQLTLKKGNVVIKNSIFSNNLNWPAIFIFKQEKEYGVFATFEKCNIHDNKSYAININKSDSVFVNQCHIYNNAYGICNISDSGVFHLFNSNIHNNGSVGIWGEGTFLIEKNKIHNNLGGISLGRSKFRIVNNEIYNNKSSMVGGIAASFPIQNSYISQNLIYNNENTKTQTGVNSFTYNNGGGIQLSNFSTSDVPVYITNNTICNNKTLGFGNNLHVQWVKTIIQNNNFFDVNKDPNSVYFASNTSLTAIENNCSNSLLNEIISVSNIFLDPFFVNPTDSIGQITNISNYDWSLKSTSNCINSGTLKNSPMDILLDFKGNPRVFNNNIDIGAYEYQGYKKLLSDSLLVIFPNPANDFIYVSLNSNLFAEFTLYDTSIKKILKVSFNDVTKIDLTMLSKGIYLYQCKLSDGSSKNGKLVKF